MADRDDEDPKIVERKNFDDLSHLNPGDGEAVRHGAEQAGTPRVSGVGSCEPVKVLSGGTLFDGLLECYVDADGNAYVTNRGTFRALRGKNDEKNGGAEAGNLTRVLARLPNGHALLAVEPIPLILPQGGTALGRPAMWFTDVLRAYKAAWRAGLLRASQVHLAEQADRLLDSLAGVGLVALIHEATAFEAQKTRGFLANLFKRIFRDEPAPWERMFDDGLVLALCQLDGIAWTPGTRHPVHLASTNEKIYGLLFGTEVGREIQRRNPSPRHGRNHHQTLAPEAQDYLRQELRIVRALAEQSSSKSEFWRRLTKHCVGGAYQTGLDFDGDGE